MKKTLSNPSLKIFWDIDGTLLNTNGAAAIPFAAAVSKFARQDVRIERKKLSGFTDYEIAQYLLESKDTKASFREITQILMDYSSHLPNFLQGSNAKIIGCVKESLNILSKLPNIELAIGTGNFLQGAKIKLEYAGLLHYFGQDNLFCSTENHWSRDLVISNAKKSLRNNQIGIVIGDSIRDILSARNSDLIVIAVATGSHSSSELLELNPDYILESNWNHQELFDTIEKILKIESINGEIFQ
jgi:phosphoglycolate phosphatase-like HAD superfamily hydrolase